MTIESEFKYQYKKYLYVFLYRNLPLVMTKLCYVQNRIQFSHTFCRNVNRKNEYNDVTYYIPPNLYKREQICSICVQ